MQELRDASDAALAIAVGRYDERALEELYVRHGSAALRLARRVLRDDALAEEVTQEVFVRLWNQPDRFDPERGSMRSWLLAQAHRRSVDVVRSETARRRREEREVDDRSSQSVEIERELVELTVAENVREVLATLDQRERDAIELAYFDGLTYREVATRLGEPEGTVKSRIRRGLSSMRSALLGAGIEGSS